MVKKHDQQIAIMMFTTNNFILAKIISGWHATRGLQLQTSCIYIFARIKQNVHNCMYSVQLVICLDNFIMRTIYKKIPCQSFA